MVHAVAPDQDLARLGVDEVREADWLRAGRALQHHGLPRQADAAVGRRHGGPARVLELAGTVEPVRGEALGGGLVDHREGRGVDGATHVPRRDAVGVDRADDLAVGDGRLPGHGRRGADDLPAAVDGDGQQAVLGGREPVEGLAEQDGVGDVRVRRVRVGRVPPGDASQIGRVVQRAVLHDVERGEDGAANGSGARG